MFKFLKTKEKDTTINTATFIDAFYKEDKLFVILKKENQKHTYVVLFFPYFYYFSKKPLTAEELKALNVKETQTKETQTKLIFKTVEDLIKARTKLLEISEKEFKIYEYDIPFILRFFLDNNLSNFCNVEYVLENDEITEITGITQPKIEPLSCAIDIEVLVPKSLGFPQPGTDPVISIAYSDSKNQNAVFFLVSEKEDLDKVVSSKEYFFFSSEKEMIESFILFLKKQSPDLVFTYNGLFDLTYLNKSYKKLTGDSFSFGDSSLVFPKSKNKRVNLEGTVHVDVYAIMKLLRYFQLFNYPKLDLNTIYSNLTGKKKKVLLPNELREAYLSKEYQKIIDYNLDDVYATLELAKEYSPIIFEISEFINYPVSDLVFTSAGTMVERLFTKHYFKNKKIIPNKPSSQEIAERQTFSFSGAFVKSPISGIHKNIAVLDFRSYHISLLISYNLSPETIDCSCCKEDPFSILKSHHTCKKKGFVPILLEEVLSLRANYKEKAKTLTKDTPEYREMYAKQYALKVFLASTYGYMGFYGARWYSRKTLEIMYSLVREKIQETIKELEDMGYIVLYGDTDSCFVEFKNIEKLKEDLYKINASLPKAMKLELENIYQSGIFVQSRDKEKSAKKRYALLDYNGNLKIKGFEYVRHDWCLLVKETQKEILKIILIENNSNKALKHLQYIISDLKNKEISNSKLIIQTFLHKPVEKYKTLNPAMSAVVNAKTKGKKIKVGDLIEYIITNKAVKTISEKSQLAEFVKEKDYDSDYYINNQLLPAILPILDEINITKEELLTNTKQKGLGEFF